jgi:hypothetical protein
MHNYRASQVSNKVYETNEISMLIDLQQNQRKCLPVTFELVFCDMRTHSAKTGGMEEEKSRECYYASL